MARDFAVTMTALALAVAVMLSVASVPQAEAVVSCGQVIQSLSPCVGYVQGGGATEIPRPCCDGVRNLNGLAGTTEDRRSVCNCLKSLAVNIPPGFPFGVIAGIPGRCGVRLPYQISTNIDCSKIR